MATRKAAKAPKRASRAKKAKPPTIDQRLASLQTVVDDCRARVEALEGHTRINMPAGDGE